MPEFNEASRRVPFLRLLIPLMVGIFLGWNLPGADHFSVIWLWFAGLLLFFGLVLASGAKNFRYKWIFGLLVWFFLIWAGFLSVTLRHQKEQKISGIETGNSFVAIPLQPPEEKPATYSMPVRVQQFRDGKSRRETPFKIMVYFQKDSLSAGIIPGRPLIIEARVEKFRDPTNPEEFNYARYMRDRGFYGRAFVAGGKWKTADLPSVNSPVIIASKVRISLTRILKEFVPEKRINQVVLALVLGEREKLSEDTRSAFINAGIIHVMAISGLHVGIIYMVIMYLLSFLKKKPGGAVLQSLLVIIFLWFYAFLVGLTPSVTRAATMFSFLGLGRALNRSPNAFNSLAISAFILLCLNPAQIRDVGFQLSYLAVTGILLFYPKIHASVTIPSWPGDRMWRLVSLSLSAQLGTFPLVLYYFHQFPTWFLLTNLVAIPLVTLIIYAGFLTLIFSFSGIFAHGFSLVITFLVKILLVSVNTIGSWPHAVIRPVFITPAGLMILYLSLAFLAAFLYFKRGKWLLYSLVTLVLFSGLELLKIYEVADHENFEVLNVPGATTLQFVKGSEACLYSISSGGSENDRVRYAATGGWNNMRIRKILWAEPDSNYSTPLLNQTLWVGENHFQFLSKKGLIISGKVPFHSSLDEAIKVNWLIISGDKWLDPKSFLNTIKPELVIVSSAVPSYLLERYVQELKKINQTFYIVKTKGAYVNNLK